MRLSLPKPLRGWRAFAGEVGIIVLGVLIALAAQQVAQGFQERAEAREARELIREELATYMGRLESRRVVRDCIANRLGELQALLDRAANGGPIDRPNWIGRPQFWTMLTVRWDAAAQSGRAALIPPAELAEYGLMYDWMRNTYDSMIIEQGDWAKLRTLEHVDSLTPQTAFDLNATLQDARFRAFRINGQTEELREIATRIKLPIRRNESVGTRGPCLPMTTPREVAVRANPFGEP